ncbi:MAG: sodium:calcium antiporter [Candidatus Altiarchaeota archaeon]|nr:sodium:calcium antiporter [Candidatus Altiarchaeota archaeon]
MSGGGLFYEMGVGLTALIVLMYAASVAVKRIHKLLVYYGYSDTFGGLVIFSMATSLPEIFSHLAASLGILSQSLDYEVASATVLGANIGSDVIQQTLILGLVVFFMGRLEFKKSFLKTGYLPMITTTMMCMVLGLDGIYSRLDGLVLISSFIAYIIYLYRRENHHKRENIQGLEKSKNVPADLFVAVTCFALMLASAHFLLEVTQEIVVLTGLGGSLIGVISLGVASASPEFFTAIFGLRHRAAGISLGTLIGSNITNPLVGIGGGALLSTYWVPKPLVYWDLPMETITAALLLAYLLKTGGRLGKWGGLYLMGLYFLYLGVRFTYFAVD